ncbi:leucine-rich repeat domain-containing protein [Listeria booriae]|uniref:leucine-rich repeat domain-containing protein n=1 Tax=Listeria booriae TaxID=1552123 RepID=UPI00162915E5|nr:WxL domain-containing protein [Listeria booriae]MBC2319922.1 hypothetical protein [Listeria booriae]
MKKKMLALMLLFMIPTPLFTDAVKASAPASDEAVLEAQQTVAEPAKKNQSLKATKLDTDTVSSADLGNQTWLINEVKRQIPAKTIGTTLTFGDLKTITSISLNNNPNLTGSIPPGIQYFSNLTVLSLYNDNLSGKIPSELGSLAQLERLSIRDNKLTGEIPKELGNLANLRSELNVANNQLTGSIPSELGNLTSFNGVMAFYGNPLTGTIPDSFKQLTQTTNFQFQNTRMSGVIPIELLQSPVITNLNVSHTQLVSPVQTPTKGNFTQAISNNQLGVAVKPTTYNASALVQVQGISNIVQPADFDNQTWLMDEIERQIPNKKIGSTMTFDDLKQITTIKLYTTPYTGHIPSGIQYLTELTELTVSNTNLTGTIPTSIGSLQHLTVLTMTSNKLQGEIPESIGNLTNLEALHLSNNQLTGDIPESIGNLESLIALHLDRNQLSGVLPNSMGNLTSLFNLILYNNNLSGELPEELGNLVELRAAFLDNNHFSGQIPTSFATSTSIQTVLLENNDFIGILPAQLYNVPYLTVMNNQITIDSALPLAIMTNRAGDTRYENTFITNSKLAGTSSTITDAKTITPFNPSSDTYFDLHYTNDGSTRQELNKDHQVTIMNTATNEVVYEGTMNPDASFTQLGTAQYQVILDNAPENPNNTINITVQQNDLTLTSVPDFLNFGTQKITSSTQTYQRADTGWEIVVDDNRKAKHDWTLTASLAAPMKGTNGQILADSLIYKDGNGTETPLTQQALAVYNYHPTENTPDSTKIKWADDEGILMKVKAGEAYAQEYQGQVEWSLVDAP